MYIPFIDKILDGTLEIVTDSRDIDLAQIEKYVFLAIVGERVDGHDFLASLYEAGLIYSIVSQKKLALDIAKEFSKSELIYCEDTIDCYRFIASQYRKTLKCKDSCYCR